MLSGPEMKRDYKFGDCVLSLIFGDITRSPAEVLVSSDDYVLSMGGGVSYAIRRAGGEAILVDAAKKVPADLGDVVVTTAGNLPARFIFHGITIGATPGEVDRQQVVANIVNRCFDLLDVLDLETIAFPALGAGVARYDYKHVAVQMAESIVTRFESTTRPLAVSLYLFDRFGQMAPLDYIDFFEEFGARMRTFSPTVEIVSDDEEDTAPVEPTNAADEQALPETSDRQKLIGELSDLSQRRDMLENRLVRMQGTDDSESDKIQADLRTIQAQRLELLAALNPSKGSGIDAFVSYAHEDESYRVELGKHLKALEREKLIQAWHDRKIMPGSNWKDAIDEHLKRSKLILLLVSADFLNSEYCYDIEMRQALEQHDIGASIVVPIIIRPAVWHNSPLARLQALPKDGKAVTQWTDADTAYVNIVEGIRSAIEGMSGSGHK